MRNTAVLGLGILFASLFVSVVGEKQAHAEKCPLVLIILDRSGSMTSDVPNSGGKDRWEVAIDAITRLVNLRGDQLPFGLLTFQEGGSSCNDFSMEARISPANGTKMQIISNLGTLMPAGLTNTGHAVREGARMMSAALAADPSRPKGFIILITDGEPTCEEGSTDALTYTVQQIGLAHDNNIDTFVVGFEGRTATETTNLSAALNMMAQAGGQPCTNCMLAGSPINWYNANSPQSLDAAIDAITNAIVSGEFGGGMCDDSCVTQGCDAGKICKDLKCVDDPCANLRSTCPADSYCWTDGTSGGCRPACAVACDPNTQYCSQDGSRCIDRQPCNMTCSVPGQVCFEGRCITDPCLWTQCPAGLTCASGAGTCSGNLTGGGGRGGRSRGGCDVSPSATDGGLGLAALGLLGLALALRSRRSRAR
jgi:MYXO-CTERM domain-containing protein